MTDIISEIEKQEKWLLQAGCNQYNVDIVLKTIKSLLTEQEPIKVYDKDHIWYKGVQYISEYIFRKFIQERELKDGHWKSTIDGKPICSECGYVSESEDGYFVSHYCPNCGAKMHDQRYKGSDKE